MIEPKKSWLAAGAYVIDAASVLYINTSARWLGAAEGDSERDDWGEVPPSRQVERTGVEVHFGWHPDRTPLRFLDGTREAEDLNAFVRSAASAPRDA
ncbi:hypothetical protein [Singulisphaera sp. GP187]|uniref:hypothetical protein n=1 Tax=Singulisphaera sp. GP187 TaxID=1882752 RepID=UPI0011610C74|nr:hypothetical protein [Singulisphaera sp. GP187]